jgi:hypothetical protein
MLNHLHNTTPLQVAACLPANNQVFRVGKARPGVHPKDTRPQLALRSVMLEEALRLRRGIMRLKTAPHHEKYIYVAWIGFSRDVTPKDNKSLQMSCAMR